RDVAKDVGNAQQHDDDGECCGPNGRLGQTRTVKKTGEVHIPSPQFATGRLGDPSPHPEIAERQCEQSLPFAQGGEDERRADLFWRAALTADLFTPWRYLRAPLLCCNVRSTRRVELGPDACASAAAKRSSPVV